MPGTKQAHPAQPTRIANPTAPISLHVTTRRFEAQLTNLGSPALISMDHAYPFHACVPIQLTTLAKSLDYDPLTCVRVGDVNFQVLRTLLPSRSALTPLTLTLNSHGPLSHWLSFSRCANHARCNH